ncbi:iron-containing alcohol dehydrogenase family protein [Clostridium oryzae]|uniref:Lactaldehyde reductase n=1 Tax=Clostridium oryzae TaxID=1450648 RepID=A0A1V4IMG8_9CLOT|nr:iron-containing alcohol dehydrogenase family protein [Clostridium oryzae]OPJ60965.1 lactaldehyde reductase [Clostridium oryzae]
MKFNYYMPVHMHFEQDAVKKYKEELLKIGTKALIVTGKHSSKKNGSLDDVIQVLNDVKIEYTIFDKVEENPSLETIEKAAAIGLQNKVDFVIGIGGGSPMDASKAIAIFIKNPNINKDNVFSSGKLTHIPVVAVATTSGTGSEVTPYSIVTVNAQKTKKNLGQKVYPEIAFLDSKYTYDLPYNITVSTAVDAFTHLVEGYLNSNSTVMTDIYGEKGFELFAECFDNLIKKDLNKEFRDKVMFASALGGIQISQNGTSLPHGMGYPLTYFKGLPHGFANGVLTVEYLKTFKNTEKLNRMLSILKLKDLSELKQIFDKLFTVHIDVTEEEIVEYSKAIFSNKGKLKNHPEQLEYQEIENIYRNSFK